MKKILFISHDGMTDPLGSSQVLPYLKGLTSKGYEFTILSAEKPNKFKLNKSDVQSTIAGFPITWVPVMYHNKIPILSAVYDYFVLRKKAYKLHKQDKFDMVHTRAGVPAVIAIWLKNKTGIKFLNDIRGFWADERVDGGMWKKSNPIFATLYNFFKRKELNALEIADYNITLTNAAKVELSNWANVNNQPLKIQVIPCSADLELFNYQYYNQQKINKLKSQFNIPKNHLVISYLGSLGGWYLETEMLQLFKLLIQKKSEATFLFITPTPAEKVYALSDSLGIDREKIIVKQAKRNQVPDLLSICDFSMFFIKACYSKIASSPTKHGEIMGMGIPVIANAGVGDVERIITQTKTGVVLQNFDNSSLQVAVESMLSIKTADKLKIREAAFAYYNLDEAVKKYAFVYNAILGQ
jgi:glycosyltransferase involved in cell wall biosynthesis